MKKIFTFSVAILFAVGLIGQTKALRNNEFKNAVREEGSKVAIDVQMPYKASLYQSPVKAVAPQEIGVGTTRYDLQSNSALGSRFWRYDNGHLAATWTGGYLDPVFSDRGSFYNYFDGAKWITDEGATFSRIETDRSGWPSYAPYEKGEIIASHTSAGTKVYGRDVAGAGAWNLIKTLPGAAVWPRICVNDKTSTIHVLNAIQSTGSNETVIYYSRSKDGGQSWSPEGTVLEQIGPSFYNGHAWGGDAYIWAEPRNGVIAFSLANNRGDLVIMKSYDDGETWEKIIPWEHPIPFCTLHPASFPDTLYSPNGAQSLMIDDNGICHIVFNVYRGLYDPQQDGWFYYPAFGFAMYWNENMDAFTDANKFRSLDVERHTEYLEDGRCFLAFGFDWDNDGKWYTGQGTSTNIVGYRNSGTIPFVNMAYAGPHRIVIALSVQDESAALQGNWMACRTFLCTYKYDEIYDEWKFDKDWVLDPKMESWDLWSLTPTKISNAGFYRMNQSYIHNFDDCTYPYILCQPSKTDQGNIYVFFNIDNYPGDALTDLSANPQFGMYTDNTLLMWVSTMDWKEPNFPELPLGISKSETVSSLGVYPNPASSSVQVSVNEDSNCVISNVTGQVVLSQKVKQGTNTINVSSLKPGIYFVNAGKETKKLIVK